LDKGLAMTVLLAYLPEIVPFSIYVLIGVVSLYSYFKLKKTGFVLIGIGFLVNAAAPLIRLALGGPDVVLRLYQEGVSLIEIGRFLIYLALMDLSFLTALAVLVIVGLVLLSKDFAAKQTSQEVFTTSYL
jgi:hypothetical protein